MQSDLIRDRIWDLNLAIDLRSIQLIQSFIANRIGPLHDLSQQEQLYTIYAATGIVLEEDKLPSIDGKNWVSSGLTIELLMSKLDKLDIQTYLGYIDTLLLKYKEVTSELIHKVQQLKLSYRLFCKFRKLISKLFMKMGGSLDEWIEGTTSFVWVLYLIYKHKNSEMDIEEQTKTLIGCMIYGLNRMEIKSEEVDLEMVKSEFSLNEVVCPEHLAKTFNDMFDHLLADRYNQATFMSLWVNDFKRQRLLDDLRLKYQHHKNTTLPVDQIKYLKLPKNLTPFRVSKPTVMSQSYNILLDFGPETGPYISPVERTESEPHEDVFDEEEESDEIEDIEEFELEDKMEEMIVQEEKGFRPMFAHHQIVDYTPLTLKTKDVQWINSISSEMDNKKIKQFQKMFDSVSPHAYEKTESFCFDLLEKLLSMTTPVDTIIFSRRNKVFALFSIILYKMCMDSQNVTDIHVLLSDFQFIKTLLCISTYIFLHSNSLALARLKEICCIYECKYPLVLYYMHKISKAKLSIPPLLLEHLRTLENTILLRHAWEDETAYEIIKSGGQDIYSQFFMKKLEIIVQQRIDDITRGQSRFYYPVKELVFYVMNLKPHLLEGNFIDQIIICALYHVMSLNPQESVYTFDDIFRIYNKLSDSFQQYKNRITFGNKTYTLFDFYQAVFIPEVNQFQVPLLDMEQQHASPKLKRDYSFDSANFVNATKAFKKNRLGGMKTQVKTKGQRREDEDEGGNSQGFGLVRRFSMGNGDESSMTLGFHNSAKKEE